MPKKFLVRTNIALDVFPTLDLHLYFGLYIQNVICYLYMVPSLYQKWGDCSLFGLYNNSSKDKISISQYFIHTKFVVYVFRWILGLCSWYKEGSQSQFNIQLTKLANHSDIYR